MKNLRTLRQSVDLMRRTFDSQSRLQIVQGDSGNEIVISVYANGKKFLLNDLTVAVAMQLPNDDKIIDHIPNLYYEGHTFTWKPRKVVSEHSGVVTCSVRIYDAISNRVTTEYFEIFVCPQIQVLDDADFEDSILDKMELLEKRVQDHEETTYTKEETHEAVISTLTVKGVEVHEEEVKFKKNIVVEGDIVQE